MSLYQGIDLRGDADLIKKLKKVQTKTGIAAIKKALRKAGNKIKNSVKQNAPIDSGNLKRSIKVFNDNSRGSKGGALLRVGADRKIAPHAHLVEFGTDERQLNKPSIITISTGQTFTVKHTGKMPANDFFNRGYESSKQSAIDTFTSEIKQALNNI
ncbi:HK97 gp10 family phage protein [Belliella sp. DSM 111904]|uniref:HK97 gp10 family phage protein n=1 Tax=Belliella filtrata TaxID=2923435 RepID=A0ABS9V423_9BACT|nr:HK97-gp10 family putative phage morphogenesis protein [Belliella filtrata]MCH7411156.1 HK97 gp10 family phage protein [Belliella filtrata]